MSVKTPANKEKEKTVSTYIPVLRFPTIFIHVVIVLKFVVGPAMRSATAAPGDPKREAIINAIGIDAVAQIYKGIETNIIIKIFMKEL